MPEPYHNLGTAAHIYSDGLSTAFKKARWRWCGGYPTPSQINACIDELLLSSNRRRDNAPVGTRVSSGGLAVENNFLYCHPKIAANYLGTANEEPPAQTTATPEATK